MPHQSEKKQEWEVELKKQFQEKISEAETMGFDWDELESFVRTKLVQARQEERGKVRGMIALMRKELPKTKCINAENHLFDSCFQCEKINGYNQALSDLSFALNEID